MKQWIALLALALAPVAGQAAIMYQGDLSDGSAYNGSLDSESGWAQSSGGEVDFWSFTGEAGESVSLLATSDETDIAFSLYSGAPDDFSQPFFFSNDGDWDLFEFVTASSSLGNEALDFVLPETGIFTLAVGGEVADFLADDSKGPFAYSVQLVKAAEVPTPGTLGLMAAGLLALSVRSTVGNRAGK